MKTLTGPKLLKLSLLLVESASIKRWATSDHNLPIIKKMAARAAAEGKTPEGFATYLTALAMGL